MTLAKFIDENAHASFARFFKAKMEPSLHFFAICVVYYNLKIVVGVDADLAYNSVKKAAIAYKDQNNFSDSLINKSLGYMQRESAAKYGALGNKAFLNEILQENEDHSRLVDDLIM